MDTDKRDLLRYILNRRVFVGLIPTEESNQEIDNFVKENGLYNGLNYEGIPVDNINYHVTLWYSRKGRLSTGEYLIDTPLTIETQGMEILGLKNDYLTLKMISNSRLKTMHAVYGERGGLISDWPKFKPHLTIVNKYTKNRIPNIHLSKIPKRIEFDKVVIKESFID